MAAGEGRGPWGRVVRGLLLVLLWAGGRTYRENTGYDVPLVQQLSPSPGLFGWSPRPLLVGWILTFLESLKSCCQPPVEPLLVWEAVTGPTEDAQVLCTVPVREGSKCTSHIFNPVQLKVVVYHFHFLCQGFHFSPAIFLQIWYQKFSSPPSKTFTFSLLTAFIFTGCLLVSLCAIEQQFLVVFLNSLC